MNAATYKLSNISLEYDAVFDIIYATTIGELYAGTALTPYTKVTSIHYQTLFKKDTTWRIDVNNLRICWLQNLLLVLLDKRDDNANKNKEIYNPNIKNALARIIDIPHQLFAASLQARDSYPELKKYFYKEHSNVTWEEF